MMLVGVQNVVVDFSTGWITFFRSVQTVQNATKRIEVHKSDVLQGHP